MAGCFKVWLHCFFLLFLWLTLHAWREDGEETRKDGVSWGGMERDGKGWGELGRDGEG